MELAWNVLNKFLTLIDQLADVIFVLMMNTTPGAIAQLVTLVVQISAILRKNALLARIASILIWILGLVKLNVKESLLKNQSMGGLSSADQLKMGMSKYMWILIPLLLLNWEP